MVLAAALLHAVWNILLKVQVDRLAIMALISVTSGAFSLFFLPFVASPASASWPYIWVSLVIHNVYYLFLVLAYKYGDLSHVYPLSRGSAPLIVTGISIIFVGELLTTQGYFAVSIIALGVISLTLTRGKDGMKNLRAVFFALGTGCLIAIPLAAFVLWRRQNWKIGMKSGAMVLVSTWIVTWAFTLAPLALVSALRESSIIFVVLFGAIFLREKLDLNRLAAIILSLGGTVLLKTSR